MKSLLTVALVLGGLFTVLLCGRKALRWAIDHSGKDPAWQTKGVKYLYEGYDPSIRERTQVRRDRAARIRSTANKVDSNDQARPSERGDVVTFERGRRA